MIQLTVSQAYPWAEFQVIDENYEPGYPHGHGDTIQDALDDYLDQAEDFYEESIKYQWR